MKKIIYFDEESVTDYLQITNGGNLNKTTELLKQTGKNAQSEGKVEVGVSTKDNPLSGFLSALIGFTGKANVNANAGVSSRADKMVKSIIQNTILTDFLESMKAQDSAVVSFEDYQLEAEKDSLTYIVMISPFMSMINGNAALDDSNEYDLAIDKVDETIRNAKGYYEFLGTDRNCENEQVVFRFNIDAFKNNYKITDLRKMDLLIYAMHVGSAKLSDLTFNGEFDLKNKRSRNPTFDEKEKVNGDNVDKTYKVYDVLMAGVQ